jgi:hypothetical protein
LAVVVSPTPTPTPTPTSTPTPTPTPTTPSHSLHVIANAQELAAQVFQGYNGTPIQIAQVQNLPKTYLVMLSGTQLNNFNQPTNIFEDVLSDAGQPDYYYLAIDKAIRAHIPRGARVIIAGHSLGGMEAQNIVVDSWLRTHYRFTNVIAFGSPRTAAPLNAHVTYTDINLRGDPVPALSAPGSVWPANSVQTVANPWQYNPLTIFGHLEYPYATSLDTYDALGRDNGHMTLRLGRIIHLAVPVPEF